nr:MAG TPA: hypothetical protein [Caudoviricetes sp.]
MYETQSQTNGLHRGFDECKMPQARCFACGILPARRSYGASSRNESARTWRQPDTGNVKTFTSNDNENFTPLATVKRWFCGAIALLSATGILLIALAGAIIWLTETYDLPWLPFVLAGLELWFIVRTIDQ